MISSLLKQITDLPPGRLPIDTHVLQSDEGGFEKVYEVITDVYPVLVS